LLFAGLTAGTAALVSAPFAGADSAVAVWGLDPTAGHDGCGCSGCAACLAHAANKLFASAAAAADGRAHPQCKCAVAQLDLVDPSVYNALFVAGGQRGSVDRRWQWVQTALVPAPPVAPPPGPVGPGPSAPAPLDPGGGETAPVRAWRAPSPPQAPRLRSTWVRREAPGLRVLFVQLESVEAVDVTLGLFPAGRSRLRRRVPTFKGRQTIRVSLGPGVAHGPARLQVKFREKAGRSLTVTRMVSIPARRPPHP
jgi:hypothetical protein